MEQTDRELIEAVRKGDVGAFQALYERHWRMAVGVAFSCLSDRHLAEDAAQDAFAIVSRKFSSLRNAERFPHWLRAICRRAATRLRRKKNKTQHEPLQTEQLEIGSREPASDTVTDAVNRLPRPAREVILLHYFSELSHEEISRALGISMLAVHGRLQRARRKLAGILHQHKHNRRLP